MERSGLMEGVRIQRWFPVEQWRAELARLPDEFRVEARQYLKEIWFRMENQKRARAFLDRQNAKPKRWRQVSSL